MVNINGKNFQCEVLSSPEDIQKGMMFRDNLNGCMLFKLNKGYHTFWMKNCKIPLDIVFVLNQKITKIYRNCQPCDKDCNHYMGYGNIIIEFPSNTSTNWNIGDTVSYGDI